MKVIWRQPNPVCISQEYSHLYIYIVLRVVTRKSRWGPSVDTFSQEEGAAIDPAIKSQYHAQYHARVMGSNQYKALYAVSQHHICIFLFLSFFQRKQKTKPNSERSGANSQYLAIAENFFKHCKKTGW